MRRRKEVVRGVGQNPCLLGNDSLVWLAVHPSRLRDELPIRSSCGTIVMDRKVDCGYVGIMTGIGRLIVALLVLAHLAGSVVHAGQMTRMSIAMTVTTDTSDMMSNCGQCLIGSEQGKSTCAYGCLAQSIAILPDLTWKPTERSALATLTDPSELEDHQSPPDPYPPRSSVLG